MGYIIYLPKKQQLVAFNQGAGDNLSNEDVNAGYTDYINYNQYKFSEDIADELATSGETAIELDGGMYCYDGSNRSLDIRLMVPELLNYIYGESNLEYVWIVGKPDYEKILSGKDNSDVTISKQRETELLNIMKACLLEATDESYIGRAFKGCVEVAEKNIKNDEWNCIYDASIKLNDSYYDACKRIIELENENNKLKAELAAWNNWIPYCSKVEYGSANYQKLLNELGRGAEAMTDERCIELISGQCGFEPSKIKVVRETDSYEQNRIGQLRVVGQRDCAPIYFSSDWNYIRFMVCGYEYEYQDGECRFVG